MGSPPNSKENVTQVTSKFGVLLDYAPPFKFLKSYDFSDFNSLVRRLGVQKISLDDDTRKSFFFDAHESVKHYYIAPHSVIVKADGALDPYISFGFVENYIPSYLNDSAMIKAIQESCNLLKTKIAYKEFIVFSSSKQLHDHLFTILDPHRGRFLESADPLQKLLKSVAAGARSIIPNGDSSKHRLTTLVSPLVRTREIGTAEAKELNLDHKKLPSEAVLVFGLDRRGQCDPVAFLPIEFGFDEKKTFHLKFPDRHIAYLLASKRLSENSEREDLAMHVIDLDLPTITPWELAYSITLKNIAQAINGALGQQPCPLSEITLIDEDRHKGLLCWIETPLQGSIPSTSLNRLDQLSLTDKPDDIWRGLKPLAAHAASQEPPEPPDINLACRLTHTDPKFPLDPYQAHAAAGVASLLGNWAQSVTGPPGTGKTSMMRDVISDHIAQKLIKGATPTLLLAGPTIQAYENLLDAVSFSWEGAPSGCERIFPDFPHIGAIIPTSTALKVKGVSRQVPHLKFYTSRKHIDHHKDFTSIQIPAEAGQIIADHPTAKMIRLLMVDGAELPFSKIEAETEIDSIKARLSAIFSKVDALHNIGKSGNKSKVLAEVWPEQLAPLKSVFNSKLQEISSGSTTEQIDAALDLTLRFEAFHLVFRLSQVQFVHVAHLTRNGQKWLIKSKNVRQTDRDALLVLFKKAISYLLPIRTATVTSLGKKSNEQFGHPADIVIIDEAGMMEPEYVPAMMAEGLCTLAVGDPYQIPPVGSDILPIHGALMLRAGVPDEQVALWSMSDLPSSGQDLGPKAGNGLSIIEAMSAYRDENALVLQRHYRCPESIIEISNELIYRPRNIPLEAMKKDPAPNPDKLPVIATILHNGPPVDGKNYNPVEADAIVTAFLMHHRAILAEAKGAPPAQEISLNEHLELMASAVAFLSPYRNQAKLETPKSPKDKATVASHAQHLPDDALTPFLGFLPNLMLARLCQQLPGQEDRVREALEKTVFGTIHALQGAERPVVFLSCVADQNTGFFNKDPALINVGVTRAQSNLVIARSASFAADDPPGTAARSIAETIRRSQVILPERVLLVESRNKGRVIERALPNTIKVISTQGSIGQVSGLNGAGQPIIEIMPSSPHVAANIAEAKQWITPIDEGGLGLKTLTIGTDADNAGDVIAHDLMNYMGLTREEIERRGLTVSRWPMEDPAALGDMLIEDIKSARSFNPEVTGRWRADRQRARTELRIALSRGIRTKLSQEAPGVHHPSLSVLRTMRWLEQSEGRGWEVHVELADATGRRFEAPLCSSPGLINTFDDKASALACAARLKEAPDLKASSIAVPSPLRTRRSLYDVLSVLSLGGVRPLKAMKVLQVFFEKSTKP